MRLLENPRMPVQDAAHEESLDLLSHLVDRLRDHEEVSCNGLEEACIFLLEHLAVRLQQQQREQRKAARSHSFGMRLIDTKTEFLFAGGDTALELHDSVQ